jgi:hypothetical protein
MDIIIIIIIIIIITIIKLFDSGKGIRKREIRRLQKNSVILN